MLRAAPRVPPPRRHDEHARARRAARRRQHRRVGARALARAATAASVAELASSTAEALTPRGILAPFSGYDDSGPYPFEAEAAAGDDKLAHDLYVWNGRQSLALTKAVALTKCFELERALINDTSGAIRHLHAGHGGGTASIDAAFRADYAPPPPQAGEATQANHLLALLSEHTDADAIECSSLLTAVMPSLVGAPPLDASSFPQMHKALAAFAAPAAAAPEPEPEPEPEPTPRAAMPAMTMPKLKLGGGAPAPAAAAPPPAVPKLGLGGGGPAVPKLGLGGGGGETPRAAVPKLSLGGGGGGGGGGETPRAAMPAMAMPKLKLGGGGGEAAPETPRGGDGSETARGPPKVGGLGLKLGLGKLGGGGGGGAPEAPAGLGLNLKKVESMEQDGTMALNERDAKAAKLKHFNPICSQVTDEVFVGSDNGARALPRPRPARTPAAPLPPASLRPPAPPRPAPSRQWRATCRSCGRTASPTSSTRRASRAPTTTRGPSST